MSSLKPVQTADPRASYWRSLEDLNDAPEVQPWREKEFASYLPEEIVNPRRRDFLALAGASAALVGLTGCRWPQEQILPHTRLPENRTPGEPVQFATAFEHDGYGIPALAASVDGRPIKLDANELHPYIKFGSSTWLQASLLSLYDPDRSRGPIRAADRSRTVSYGEFKEGKARRPLPTPMSTWAEFLAFASQRFGAVRAAQGAGLVILARPSDSPTFAAMRAQVREKLPLAYWAEWGPATRDNVTLGLRAATGERVRPHLMLENADVIVSLDDDFLYHHPASIRYARDFGLRRRPKDGKINRLHVIEPALSLTGTLADVRTAIRGAELAPFLARVAALLAEGGVGASNVTPAKLSDKAEARAAQVAKDLLGARGRSVITAGAHLPPEIHAQVAVLNEALGNVGKTIRYTAEPRLENVPPAVESIREVVNRLNGGQCKTLLILGGNPVYDAPADLKFAEALAKAEVSIHLSEYDDETSQRCTWHVNQAHYLEAWGDTRSYDGTISVVQPLIHPLYDGRTIPEMLSLVLSDTPRKAYELVRESLHDVLMRIPAALGPMASQGGGTLTQFDIYWNRALHSGFINDTALPTADVSASGREWVSGFAALANAKPAGKFEVAFRVDYSVAAGEFANNGWLQELPDPLTKLTWDNAAILSPQDADALGVRRMDRIEVRVGGAAVVLPVFVLPGQAQGVITALLGYGRKAAGVVGEKAGFDVYPLRRSDGMSFAAAEVTKASGDYLLASTQDHYLLDTEVSRKEYKRRLPELFREISIDEFNKDARGEVAHAVHLPVAMNSLWKEFTYDTHRWGMAIDLSTCVACNACVTACQAENNVPVVGKLEVEEGRVMHWIRVDRYFRGDPADPSEMQFAHQVVLCQHCEMAPCESVCPVAATVHDSEGINVMVYNRCIGTRYCSNNCPYKVRRFNWFYNHYGPRHPRSLKFGTITPLQWRKPSLLPSELKDPIEQMVHNPEVTVRSRGVMEKCTFCYQRIAHAKIRAKNKWASMPAETRGEKPVIKDGTIRTACQEACPSDAIVFGDLADPNSRVAQLHKEDRGYVLLEMLYTKPRVKYLARVADRGGEHGHGALGHDAHRTGDHGGGHHGQNGHDGHDAHGGQQGHAEAAGKSAH
jgi:MoCo/4Fe-4S cofactor protein with predicted Tat translocation signal